MMGWMSSYLPGPGASGGVGGDLLEDEEEEEEVLQSHAMEPVSSSSRQARNQAEKNRRDKLNQYIKELSTLVPSVMAAEKKLDKTSILRHSAAHLRLYKFLRPAGRHAALSLPMPDPLSAMQMILEEVNGILFVIAASGKIVFVSESVQRVLGHTQADLLGHSIYSLVCPADQDCVKRNLQPDEDPMAERMLGSSDDSSSDDTGTSASMSSDHSAPDSPGLVPGPPGPPGQPGQPEEPPPTAEPAPVHQKRFFFMRMRQRPMSRTDHEQYELVSAHGYLRIPGNAWAAGQHGHRRASHGHRRRSHDSSSSANDTVLVAVIQLVREPRICEESLLEATKDEYITRHTMDGRIIYCDHRISLVSGYLSEEVAGLSAFKYMHKDDVRWTMVALRHMLSRGEDYGSSCYRLKAKTGEFIYLKTYGYLEKDDKTQALNSFICINVLVPPEEGEVAILEMHKRFSPQILSDSKPRKSGVTIKELPDEVEASTESEENLEPLVNQLLLSNIPEPSNPASPGGSTPAPNEHYAKVTFVSKSLPSALIHTARVGITNIPKVSTSPMSHSPRQPVSPSSSRFSPWNPQHPHDVSSSSEEFGRPSVVKVAGDVNRPSIISGRKRSYDGHQRDDEPKRSFGNVPRFHQNSGSRLSQVPLSVDVNTSLREQGAPKNSPQSRAFPIGVIVHDTQSPSDPNPCPDSPVAVFPNGGWGRSDHLHQTGPAQALSNQVSPELQTFGFHIFPGEDLPETFQSEEETGLGVTGMQPQHPLQDPLANPVHRQLIFHQYQLGSDLNVQGEQITNLAQDLKQVPNDTPECRMLADSLNELTEEHSQQEKLLQQLHRETVKVKQTS